MRLSYGVKTGFQTLGQKRILQLYEMVTIGWSSNHMTVICREKRAKRWEDDKTIAVYNIHDGDEFL